MAKSKLVAALDAHRGRDYKLEKQKKLQKQAAKRKKSKAPESNSEGKENVKADTNGSLSMLEAESDDRESAESKAAESTAVCRTFITKNLHDTNEHRSIHPA